MLLHVFDQCHLMVLFFFCFLKSYPRIFFPMIFRDSEKAEGGGGKGVREKEIWEEK